MQRIALYARVSTVDRGQDPEVQLRELRAWAARLGVEVVLRITDATTPGRAVILVPSGASENGAAR